MEKQVELFQYIGTKKVSAGVMSKGDAAKDYGVKLSDSCKYESDAEGYLVVYEGGYKSWSPKEVFEKAYRKNENLTFGLAIELLKMGKKVCRVGWNGKNMFIVYMPPLYLPPYNTTDTARKVNDRTAKWIGEDKPLDCQPYIAMYNAQEQWQPGWLPSQADLLSEDWMVVNE